LGIEHVLITNDDGVHRRGIQCLADIAAQVFDRVTVVAPASEMSGVSHGITLTRPLRSRKHANGYYSVDGTPADCVITALGYMCAEDPPDLVLSGINHGPNLGHDVFYSGTVAGAREGFIKGVPAVAFSLARPRETSFDAVSPIVRNILEQVRRLGVPAETMLNVNIPEPEDGAEFSWCGVKGVRGLRTTTLGHRTYTDNIDRREDPRGSEYFWIGGAMPVLHHGEGTDCGAILDGYVSMTPLTLEVTKRDAFGALAPFQQEEV
jgi:5'-nucleotidase